MGILVSQSRYLAMRMCTFCFDFIVVDFHAPHAKNLDTCKQWWQHCVQQVMLLQKSHQGLDFTFLTDSNARPPSPDYVSVGAHGAHKWSASTSYFADFIKKCQVWLPAMFAEFNSPQVLPGSYYWSQEEIPVLIDHIMLHGDVRPVHETYDTIYVDNKKQALDHLLVTMSLLFARKHSNKACPRSRAPYNRAHVSCPSGMARMSQFLQQIPCVQFEAEPSTHLFLVQQYLRDAASLAYPAQVDFVKKKTGAFSYYDSCT